MKEKLFALFWVLFFALPLYAQADKTGSYSIKGQVLDSLSNESVPYATLRIAFAKTPEKPVKLLACDVDGKFQAPLSSAGKYIISMQSIGKAPAEKIFTISDKQRNLDLGKLYMQEDNQRLGEVTVTAQKPLVKAEIDKLTYSLEDDPEAQTNNTLDMLRKVPMVTVDGDDQIQLKGSTNFKIYMNGKPSNLLSNNPAEVLKSMPANSVKNTSALVEISALSHFFCRSRKSRANWCTYLSVRSANWARSSFSRFSSVMVGIWMTAKREVRASFSSRVPA